MDALPCCFGTIYSQAPMAAVRLAMGAFLLFASGLAGAKAHASLNGGVCVRRQRKACRLPLAGAVCLPRAGILPHKAAAPSAAAKGNRQPLCWKPLFGRGGFRPCHGRNAPAPFMCAHWLPKRVLRCGNVLLWQECPSARSRPRRPALFICVRAGWPERALRYGTVLLWQECPSARPRPRRPALFICVRAGWPKRAVRCGNVLLWQECPSARPRPKAAGARYAWARRSGKRQEQFGAGAALRAV